ncbi:PREDICTED: uncharacterized protein LOC105449520 [Wasmannia auropunctata]|uniref:uncharacterized protein LOC105449520 n=1 Tax=Wasmannia auropunctata TaxID=64793 RepID=UPI0005ED715F|nr:PREDICTED: uncharacterized protein LOC105449520 [Wasmannia auropunctata]
MQPKYAREIKDLITNSPANNNSRRRLPVHTQVILALRSANKLEDLAEQADKIHEINNKAQLLTTTLPGDQKPKETAAVQHSSQSQIELRQQVAALTMQVSKMTRALQQQRGRFKSRERRSFEVNHKVRHQGYATTTDASGSIKHTDVHSRAPLKRIQKTPRASIRDAQQWMSHDVPSIHHGPTYQDKETGAYPLKTVRSHFAKEHDTPGRDAAGPSTRGDSDTGESTNTGVRARSVPAAASSTETAGVSRSRAARLRQPTVAPTATPSPGPSSPSIIESLSYAAVTAGTTTRRPSTPTIVQARGRTAAKSAAPSPRAALLAEGHRNPAIEDRPIGRRAATRRPPRTAAAVNGSPVLQGSVGGLKHVLLLSERRELFRPSLREYFGDTSKRQSELGPCNREEAGVPASRFKAHSRPLYRPTSSTPSRAILRRVDDESPPPRRGQRKGGHPVPSRQNGHPPLQEAQAISHPPLQEAQASSHPPPQEASATEEARSATYESSAPANGQPRNANRGEHFATKSAGRDADEAVDARASEAAQPHEAADSRATEGSLHPDLSHAQSPASDAVKAPTTFRVPGALRGPPPAAGTGVAGSQPIENGHLNPAATDSTFPAQAIRTGPDEGPL